MSENGYDGKKETNNDPHLQVPNGPLCFRRSVTHVEGGGDIGAVLGLTRELLYDRELA